MFQSCLSACTIYFWGWMKMGANRYIITSNGQYVQRIIRNLWISNEGSHEFYWYICIIWKIYRSIYPNSVRALHVKHANLYTFSWCLVFEQAEGIYSWFRSLELRCLTLCVFVPRALRELFIFLLKLTNIERFQQVHLFSKIVLLHVGKDVLACHKNPPIFQSNRKTNRNCN